MSNSFAAFTAAPKAANANAPLRVLTDDSPHYRRYREQVGLLIARPSDVAVHHLETTVHALDPNPPDPGELG